MINPDNRVNVYKTRGKVADLEEYVADKDVSGTIGIAIRAGPPMASPTAPMPTPTCRATGK